MDVVIFHRILGQGWVGHTLLYLSFFGYSGVGSKPDQEILSCLPWINVLFLHNMVFFCLMIYV